MIRKSMEVTFNKECNELEENAHQLTYVMVTP